MIAKLPATIQVKRVKFGGFLSDKYKATVYLA